VRGAREGAHPRVVVAGRGGGAGAEPDRALAFARCRRARLPERVPDGGGDDRCDSRRGVDLRLLPADAPARPRAGAAADKDATMNTTLLLSSVSLVLGGLLLVVHVLAGRREPLAVRLARVEGRLGELGTHGAVLQLPGWLAGLHESYGRDLRRAGGEKTLRRFLAEKALLAFAAPFVVLAPYAAATTRLPSLALVVLLAAGGFFVPDLVLRQQVKQRRE